MERQFRWEVKIIVENEDCAFADDGVCTLLTFGDNHCTYGNCPRKVPKTCKDCRYLFFNQNPEEKFSGVLRSMCGVKGYKDIHAGDILEAGHYRIPGWCPVRYDMSNVETLELVKD